MLSFCMKVICMFHFALHKMMIWSVILERKQETSSAGCMLKILYTELIMLLLCRSPCTEEGFSWT